MAGRRCSVTWLLALGVLAMLSCPAWIFWLAARSCSWPELPSGAPTRALPQLHALVVSDAHVLGRRRTVLDRMWTDWGLASGFVAAVARFRPDVVLNLGDVVDEVTGGKPYEAELSRAHRIFLRRESRGVSSNGGALAEQASVHISMQHGTDSLKVPYFAVVGNHDARTGLHYLHDALVHRFGADHGFSTGVFSVKNVTFARINSMALHPRVTSKQSQQRLRIETFLKKMQQLQNESSSDSWGGIDVLLTHMPLYRKDDMRCGKERDKDPPGGGVTYYPKSKQLIEHEDCIGEEESKMIVASILPRNVLSGHTHIACRMEHSSSLFEVQVPSFGWRMRPDAGYVLMVIQPGGKMDVEFCALPNEHTLIAVLVLSGAGAVGLLLEILLRGLGITACCQKRVKNA